MASRIAPPLQRRSKNGDERDALGPVEVELFERVEAEVKDRDLILLLPPGELSLPGASPPGLENDPQPRKLARDFTDLVLDDPDRRHRSSP